ncbi:hypothetical protein X975_24681, partial [Stegodyphus mimosarum]
MVSIRSSRTGADAPFPSPGCGILEGAVLRGICSVFVSVMITAVIVIVAVKIVDCTLFEYFVFYSLVISFWFELKTFGG